MNWIRQKKNIIIIAIIFIFAVFGLWLRFLPMEQLTSGPVPKVIFMDPWYSLRQIEVIASNFPAYPWFDPMNGYPTGKGIDWGPLYPTLTAAIVVLLGASTRNETVTIASWIPPLLSLVMIPIIYNAGKTIADRKVGVIAACLISVIAGEYLYRSFYGYLDHHFLEVIFSTAFIALYLVILHKIHSGNIGIPWRNKKFILISAIAGVVYYMGMMNIPTIILFCGIIGLFCLIHAIISPNMDFMKAISTSHAVIFGIFIILYVIAGIHEQGFSLDRYTISHIPLSLILIFEPIFLMAVIHYVAGRSRTQIAAVSIGIPFLTLLLISILAPIITLQITGGIREFFFFPYSSTFINEMQMWDLTRAWHSFNIALLLMMVGLILTVIQIRKKYNPVKIFALIWALVILISTILHLRYEYYVAVIVVLYSAIALSWLYELLQERTSHPFKNITKQNKQENKPFNYSSGKKYIPIVVTGILILIITALSAQITWVVATEQLKIISMSDDWVDSLQWLEQNTPDPGIDYLKIYKTEGFSYPENSYGVLSWWDYGHWITELGRRIPITTPFQNNVAPVAQFLLATDEKSADILAKETGAKYIIIDYEMLSSKYPSLPLWAFGPTARDKYQKYYYQQSTSNQNQYDPILTLKPDYFNSMLSRLYVFDGSKTNSTGANLVSYTNMQVGGQLIPAVSKINSLSPEQAENKMKEGLFPGTDLVAVQYTHPISIIPALTHYRLVYESPTITASDEYAQIHNVKIFERVAGYQISGSGTIEIPLITNQGRAFTYRQDSSEGIFKVPYSTQRDGNGTRATGPYKNVQTGETYEVTEEQIQTSQP